MISNSTFLSFHIENLRLYSFMGSIYIYIGFPGGASGKEPACRHRRRRDTGLIPGSGRSPGGGDGTPPGYSCLKHPLGRGV